MLSQWQRWCHSQIHLWRRPSRGLHTQLMDSDQSGHNGYFFHLKRPTHEKQSSFLWLNSKCWLFVPQRYKYFNDINICLEPSILCTHLISMAILSATQGYKAGSSTHLHSHTHTYTHTCRQTDTHTCTRRQTQIDTHTHTHYVQLSTASVSSIFFLILTSFVSPPVNGAHDSL